MQVDLQRLAEALWRAPFVLLAHNKFEGGAVVDDPVYVYANRAALRLFEATWDELVGLPSRRSAAPEAQADRDALIARAVEGGAIEDYEGWRVSLKGRRFKIRGARFFNVEELGGEAGTGGMRVDGRPTPPHHFTTLADLSVRPFSPPPPCNNTRLPSPFPHKSTTLPVVKTKKATSSARPSCLTATRKRTAPW